MRVLVKICGVRTAEEARVAAEAGADFLGFNFWPGSPRYCEPQTARAIIDGLHNHLPTVGVFVNEEKDKITGLAANLGLTAVQLHGDESRDYCNDLHASWRALGGAATQIIKAFRVAPDFDPGVIAGFKLSMALLDASVSGRYGGTGKVFDWKKAVAAKRFAPIMLAGGLDSKNVEQAIENVGPAAIDVCSGVESAPGRKDLGKLREFIQIVREINARVEATS